MREDALKWLEAGGRFPEDLKSTILRHKNSIEKYIFDRDKPVLMSNYLKLLEESAADCISAGLMRPFGFLDMVDSYLNRSMQEDKMELRAFLVEYKLSHFTRAFIDDADYDNTDLEFELRRPYPYERFRPGTVMELGSYMQNPVAWRVMALEGDRALLISEEILECRQYHSSWERVFWENSDLRSWLNGEFYEKVFSPDEKAYICLSELVNPDNHRYVRFHGYGGPVTLDRVFLLDIDEAEEYFTDNDSRRARPTANALSSGAEADEDGCSSWWLRSPGSNGNLFAAYVYSSGIIDPFGLVIDHSMTSVRPAIWLDISCGDAK